jgi:general secretion pathway protein H
MPTLATGRSRISRHLPLCTRPSAGFTLLELLVVVTIVAIFVGMAVLSIGVAGDDRDLQQESFRLKSLLDLVREEALMQYRDFGIYFSATGYRFYIYDYQQLEWVEPLGDNLLTERPLRQQVNLELVVEGRDIVLPVEFEPDALSDPMPQVMILSSGEVTPFEAALVRPFSEARVNLRAEINGTIEINTGEAAF